MTSAARSLPITAKQLINLRTYGFLDVDITDRLPDGQTEAFYEGNKLSLEKLVCNANTAEQIRQHLIKIGWTNDPT